MYHYKLLIIGAGASGISAASRLLENGFSDFRILEAGSRIGGRINTTSIGNIPIELGAEWIHGEIGNVVYEMASKFGLTDNTYASEDKNMISGGKFFDFSGNQVNKDISRHLCDVYHDILNVDPSDLSEDALKSSLGQYFEVKFQEKTDELKGKLNIDDKLCRKFLRVFENWENSIDASHSWYETSLSGHLEYWECEGNILTQWKNCHYDTVFKLLSKKISNKNEELPVDEKIIFNKEVVKINWNKDSKFQMSEVEVECVDGTKYYADYILITCSLGVLKERALTMFSPSLPKQKLDCIQNLGFGTVDKIFLKFGHQWWEDDCEGFYFLWSDEEVRSDLSGWLHGVTCFHPVDCEYPILRGWITGETARHMESLSNTELVEGFNYLLNKFLGSSYFVPPVEVCLTSKWYLNPYFRGSYSCRLMQSEKADVWASQLAEPLNNSKGKPVILFGGEATHNHYFSTVHGAIEAGYREADRVLERIKVMKSSL